VSQHRYDIFRGTRGRNVDRADTRVRMRRANEHAVSLVWLRRILDKAAAAANERIILDTRLEMMIVLGVCLIHARPPLVGQS
jgi:hypothetical protein